MEDQAITDRRWELREYYRITRWSLATLAPLAAALVVLSAASGSITLFFFALQSCVGVLAGAFEVLGIRRALVENAFSVMHGPGKFESFAAFLRGVFTVPLALFTIYLGVMRWIDPMDVDYELALVALILVLARAAFSLWLKQCLMRRLDDPSPRLRVAYSLRRGATISSIVVLAILTVGLAFEDGGMVSVGDWFDPLAAVLASLYALPVAVNLCLRNFDSLVDRPLPAGERSFAEGVVERLAGDDFAWSLRTRMDGHARVVEVEVAPTAGQTLAGYEPVYAEVAKELEGELGEVRFAVYLRGEG